jgi:hypothetical protein
MNHRDRVHDILVSFAVIKIGHRFFEELAIVAEDRDGHHGSLVGMHPVGPIVARHGAMAVLEKVEIVAQEFPLQVVLKLAEVRALPTRVVAQKFSRAGELITIKSSPQADIAIAAPARMPLGPSIEKFHRLVGELILA